MDKSAIEKIQESITVEQVNMTILGSGAACVAAMPEDVKAVDLEKFMPFKRRLTGAFNTAFIDGFASFVKKHASAYATPEKPLSCFIDQEALSAKIIFDLGDNETPLHCDFSAGLKPKPTEPYKAVNALHSNPQKQRGFADWLEDYRDFITCLDNDGNTIHIAKAVAAVRNITQKAERNLESQERDFGKTRSAIEQIDASSSVGVLPSFITFNCVPYVGFESIELTLRVTVRTGDEPTFIARILRIEMIEEKLADEFTNLVEQSLSGENISFHRGSLVV